MFVKLVAALVICGSVSARTKELHSTRNNASVGHVYAGSVNRTGLAAYYFDDVPIGANDSLVFHISMGSHTESLRSLFVVVHSNQSTLSLHLPYQVQGRNYLELSRTLCYTPYGNGTNDTIFVAISTASEETVDFKLSLNYTTFIVVGGMGDLKITPSRPIFLASKMPESADAALIKFMSEDEGTCAIVSVQSSSCPVYDEIDTVNYKGSHQTMTTRAGVNIKKSEIESWPWVFLVMIMMPHVDVCREMYSLIPRHNTSNEIINTDDDEFVVAGYAKPSSNPSTRKQLTIFVEPFNSDDTYTRAVSITLGIIGGLYALFFAYAFYCYCRNQRLIKKFLAGMAESTSVLSGTGSSEPTPFAADARDAVDDPPFPFGVPDHAVAVSGPSTVGGRDEPYPPISQDSSEDEDLDRLSDLRDHKDLYRMKSNVCVADLARKTPKRLRKKYKLYAWNLVTVAIFYALPVLHLMIAYQTVYFKSGNEDLCYYNFWCSRPWKIFASFNNVFSNIGYVSLGLLFYLITYQKHVNYHLKIEIRPNKKSQGIPKHFGLFYAIGLALMMEGVMSACYHVCPNWFNFQFDVSFMFMIGGLGMLRMYQSRHPDVNANAHSAFFGFAVIIAISVLGTIFNDSAWFWSLFIIFYFSITFYLTCQIYYLGTVKLDWKIFQRAAVFIRTEYLYTNRPFRNLLPAKPDRFVLLTIGNIFNWAFGVVGFVVKPQSFGTYLVAIFIVNLMLYFLFYVIMKLRIGERVYCLPLVLGSVNLVTWLSALWFFYQASSNWQLSPALSRQLNRDCELLAFYDYHDIWHFLSAISLFLSFLVVLILDDDLDHTDRTKIKVF